MTNKQTILHSYFRSSASWRVRIALAIKKEKYVYKSVDLIKDGGIQHSEGHHALNPLEQVPVLEIDGLVLTQSVCIAQGLMVKVAMLEYLEESREGKSLLPNDKGLRAKVRSIVEIINSGIQPIQNLSVLQRLKKLTGREIAGDLAPEWGGYYIRRGFQGLEEVLEKSSGIFCVGDEITMADICLVPQVFNANRFKVDMSEFPTIKRINDELVKQDVFIAACQSNQPDTPKE